MSDGKSWDFLRIVASRKAREKLKQAHCREFRLKIGMKISSLRPKYLRIGMSSSRGGHFSSAFLPSLKKRYFETKQMISWVALSRLL